MTVSGPQGGPFSPPSFQYRVRASSGTVRYSIRTPSWLTVSSSLGAASTSGVVVTFTVNQTALRLRPGSYGPGVAFTNVTNGKRSATRTAKLTIMRASEPPPPSTGDNGRALDSTSNHAIGGNTSGGTATPTATGSATTIIAKNIVTDFKAACNGVASDNVAFTAFNKRARAQVLPITLKIPSGSVCLFSNTTGSGNWFAKGIKNLLVVGYGATISDNNGKGNGFFLGGIGVIQDNRLGPARIIETPG
jgi:hypothetical protein